MKLCECGCGKQVTNLVKETDKRRNRIKGQPYRFIHGHGRFKVKDYVLRFWKHVNKKGPIHPILKTRCWLWIGCTDSYGYGRASWKRISMPTHRLVWFLTHGEWPKYNACHHCDNPPCVRPDHLFDADHAANSADMVAKNRTKHGAAWYAAHNKLEKI